MLEALKALDRLNRWQKLGIVIGGYFAAVVTAIVGVMLYDRRFTAQDNQTMGGMIAGGEMIFFCGVFAIVSIVPTGLALWFVRNSRRVWSWFSAACLAFAGSGLVVVIAMMAFRSQQQQNWIILLPELFGLTHELGFPVWLGGFVLFAILAPWQDLRKRLLVAAACEAVVGVFALIHFLPAYFN